MVYSFFEIQQGIFSPPIKRLLRSCINGAEVGAKLNSISVYLTDTYAYHVGSWISKYPTEYPPRDAPVDYFYQILSRLTASKISSFNSSE